MEAWFCRRFGVAETRTRESWIIVNIFFIALSFALPPVVWLIGAYLTYTFRRGWLTLIFILAWVASLVVSVSLLNPQIRDMTAKDYGNVLGAAWVAWVVGSIVAWIVGYFISDDHDDDAENKAFAEVAAAEAAGWPHVE